MREAGRREHELQGILEEAKLGYLTDREGGWDTRKEWKDVLSGGEKQRMGIARLLYHEPRFAFIDEGTSAVSSDVEGLLYERAKGKGISKSCTRTHRSARRPANKKTSISSHHDINPCLAEALSLVHAHARPGRRRQRV
jgi:ATP-binding cassette subfamily D (ALD) long-chain fatty acid import protein